MSIPVPHCSIAVALCVVLAGFCASARAATYYVDFEGGSDAGPGTSPQQAFQRCPGDPEAAANAASTVLAPGDSVIFKGGVAYRGAVVCQSSGEQGAPITYDGNTAGTFGKGRAIVDGSEPLGGWKRCASADECGGSPNWRNIITTYVADVDSPFALNLYDGSDMIWLAQSPNQDDPFYLDNYQDYQRIPNDGATQTTITDPAVFTQKDAHYWAGAYVAILAKPMYVYFQGVTGYDPASGTIHYEELQAEHYVKTHPGLGGYMMLNSLKVLDRPGECVLSSETDDAGRQKLYVWPVRDGDPAAKKLSLSRRITAFSISGQSYLTVQGFLIEKFISKQPHRGAGVSNDTEPVTGLVIRDNEIRYCNKDSSWKHAGINLGYARDSVVEGNYVYENRRCGGIYILGGSENVRVRDNTIRRDGYQGIWIMGASNCQVVGNKVLDNKATHSNGISTYSRARNILVFGNTVMNSNAPFTSNTAFDVTVAYNVFLDGTVADWGNCRGLNLFNNVMLGGVMINRNSTDVIVRNCICTRPSLGDNVQADHNISVGGRSRRGAESGDAVDASAVFVDPEGRDFRLKPDSPAIDAGTDVGLDHDMAGTAVPQGRAPDIGAYEYVSR